MLFWSMIYCHGTCNYFNTIVLAEEEHLHKIAEVRKANSTFEKDDAISKNEVSLFTAEDNRNSSLMLLDQELTKRKEEEALKFKEVITEVLFIIFKSILCTNYKLVGWLVCC